MTYAVGTSGALMFMGLALMYFFLDEPESAAYRFGRFLWLVGMSILFVAFVVHETGVR